MPENEAMLQYVKSIDERTARMETSLNTTLETHDKRLSSLETSRTIARTGLATLALGGTGGAAKLGMLDKLMSLFNSGA